MNRFIAEMRIYGIKLRPSPSYGDKHLLQIGRVNKKVGVVNLIG
jgi:hypothetical protein